MVRKLMPASSWFLWKLPSQSFLQTALQFGVLLVEHSCRTQRLAFEKIASAVELAYEQT